MRLVVAMRSSLRDTCTAAPDPMSRCLKSLSHEGQVIIISHSRQENTAHIAWERWEGDVTRFNFEVSQTIPKRYRVSSDFFELPSSQE